MPLTKKTYKILIFILKKQNKTPEEIYRIADLLTKIDDFAPLISTLSTLSLEELANSLKVSEFKESETIFLKGSYSDKLYIIVKGKVLLYDSNDNISKFLVTTLKAGKVLGERGVIRHLPRSLTAVSKKHTYLLTMDLSTYRNIMRNQLHSNIEEKIAFLDEKFPRSFGFKAYQKEKIAYCIDIKQYKKDEVIVEQGQKIEYWIILHSGECLLMKNSGLMHIKVSSIGPGCMIADECVFNDEPSHFTYKVVTDNAKFYFVKKQHLFLQCSQDLISKFSALCRARIVKRSEIAQGANRVTTISNSLGNIKTKLPQANPNVKKIISISYKDIYKNESSFVCLPKQLNRSKDKLVNLRKRVNLNRSLIASRSSINNSIIIS